MPYVMWFSHIAHETKWRNGGRQQLRGIIRKFELAYFMKFMNVIKMGANGCGKRAVVGENQN